MAVAVGGEEELERAQFRIVEVLATRGRPQAQCRPSPKHGFLCVCGGMIRQERRPSRNTRSVGRLPTRLACPNQLLAPNAQRISIKRRCQFFSPFFQTSVLCFYLLLSNAATIRGLGVFPPPQNLQWCFFLCVCVRAHAINLFFFSSPALFWNPLHSDLSS